MAKIRIKDVAKHAGVSVATVSQVLGGKGRISESTRELVQKSLDELGYVYNQVAANLRSNQSNHIGLLLHDISNPFYGEMAAGVARVMDEKGNMLFLTNSEDDIGKQNRLTKSLIQNGAAGIVICASNDTPRSYFEDLGNGNIPVVLITRHEDKGMDFVGTDNILAGRMATDYLLSLGHKRIAFIGGVEGTRNRENRIIGYRESLIEGGVEFDAEIVLSTGSSRKEGSDAIKQILQNHQDVTACLFYQDIIAHGAIAYLNSEGIKAGKDISIMGLDGIEESSTIYPRLTSVSFSANEMGEQAGRLIFDRMSEANSNISAPGHSVRKVILQPKLMVGESTGPAQ